MGDEYVSLIQFLLDRGADPNILRKLPWRNAQIGHLDGQGTTYDQIAGFIAWFAPNTSRERMLTVLDKLAAAGGQFSRPLSWDFGGRLGCWVFTLQVEHLNVFEDQIDR